MEEQTTSPLGNCRSVHDFLKINRIGEGTYGYVYRARERTSGEIVALKRIILHNEEQDGFPLTSIREIKTLRTCSHTHIVQLLDVVVGSNRDAVFLLFEYCEHDLSTLCKFIKHPFKESEIKTLTFQLLSALEYLHAKWIVHRDIKLANLLYTRHGCLKLADFGLARTISYPPESDLTPVVVTLWYRAPEVLLGATSYGPALDLWSTGCILCELLLGYPLFEGNNELETTQNIFQTLGAPSERIWPEVNGTRLVRSGAVNLYREQQQHPYNQLVDRLPRDMHAECIDLINALFTYRPENRLTARGALSHNYFHNTRPLMTSSELMPTFPSFHDQLPGSSVKQEKGQQQQKQQQQRMSSASVSVAVSQPSRSKQQQSTLAGEELSTKRKRE